MACSSTHLAVLLALCSASGAGAQVLLNPQPLKRADQGIDDVQPLAISLRELQIDLRRPSGFDSVYRIDRTSPFSGREQLFMRMDGGITATFPRSLYVETETTLVPTVPPGTKFYIGSLPDELQPASVPRQRPPTFHDLAVDHRVALSAPTLVQPGPVPGEVQPSLLEAFTPPTIWTDDEYRKRRIASLLRPSEDAVSVPRGTPPR